MTRPLGLEETVGEMREAARERSFGVIDPDRRAAVEHGYLLALEELLALLAEDPRPLPYHAA